MSVPEVASVGPGWAVSTPHSFASEAAARVLASGGNAVDAALAAAAMLTVVYPNQCSLGGDLIALVGTPDGQVQAVNASGRAPAAVDVSTMLTEVGSMPVHGALAVTVPGVVSGWEALRSQWGTRGLSDLLAEAESAARAGVPVAAGLARDLLRERAKLSDDPGLREIFISDGQLLKEGSVLRQERLADSLGLLRTEGARAFYQGQIGEHLVDELRGRGSSISMEDLNTHEVDRSSAISTQFSGTEYVTTNGNSQGVFFLAGLRALELMRGQGCPLDPLGEGAGKVASVLALAAWDGDQMLGDDDHATQDAEFLLSDEHVQSLLRLDAPMTAKHQPAAHGDTAAVTVTDGQGLWVSLLQSVFHAFGAGILEPRTGIVLHNRGASFTLQAGSPNRLTPGKRPPHTLMPVMTRNDGRITGCRAVMGGRAQPQIQTHLAIAMAGGATAEAAVSRPRWILGTLEAGLPQRGIRTARIERGVADVAVRSIERTGLAIEFLDRQHDDAGHAHVIRAVSASRGPGGFEAATDPRADGSALTGASSYAEKPW